MKKSLLLSLIFLVACGKDAPLAEADKYIINQEKPEALTSVKKLSNKANEIIILAFPKQSEVANFSFELSSDGNYGDLKTLFDLLPYGKKFLSDITKEMTPSEKVQGLIGKILTISDARDNSRRISYNLRKEIPGNISQEIKEITDKLNKIPCYKVNLRGHENFNKCYQNPVEGVTEKKPKKKWIIDNCNSAMIAISSYLKNNISSSSEENLSTLSQLNISEEDSKKLQTCQQNNKRADELDGFSGNVKMVVDSLLSNKAFPETDALIFMASSESDNNEATKDKEHTIIFNPETLVFEKFSVAINFNDGHDYVNYGPEYGNMTQPVVTEINGSGYYKVDFEIDTPKFILKPLEKGLSMTFDPIFGLRISGKTSLEYKDKDKDGRIRTRAGIMRIDILPQDETADSEKE